MEVIRALWMCSLSSSWMVGLMNRVPSRVQLLVLSFTYSWNSPFYEEKNNHISKQVLRKLLTLLPPVSWIQVPSFKLSKSSPQICSPAQKPLVIPLGPCKLVMLFLQLEAAEVAWKAPRSAQVTAISFSMVKTTNAKADLIRPNIGKILSYQI